MFTININSSLSSGKSCSILYEISYVTNAKKSIYYDDNNMQTHRRQSEKKRHREKINTEKFSFMNFIN